MEEKRQQVEPEQKRCQVSLAVPKVMFDMIALGFEHVVVFVRNFPSPTACLGDLRDVVRAQAMIGDKAVVIELCTRCGIDRGDLQPMHGQGPWATSQQDIIQIPTQRDFSETAIPPACYGGWRAADPTRCLEAHDALGMTLFFLGDYAAARTHLVQGRASTALATQ